MTKESKYQQYFHCFVVCIQVAHAFQISYQQNMVAILKSASLRSAAFIRSEAFISLQKPKGAVLIRGNTVCLWKCRIFMISCFGKQPSISIFIKKETPAQVLCRGFYKILRTFIAEHLTTTSRIPRKAIFQITS